MFLYFKGNDEVILCAIPYNLVQHYVNQVHVTPILMNPSNPSIGISNSTVSSKNGWLICSFTRMIFMPNQQNYFDLSNPYYLLASFGTIASGNFLGNIFLKDFIYLKLIRKPTKSRYIQNL